MIAGHPDYDHVDGTGSNARFQAPRSMSLSPDGSNVVVWEESYNGIRKIVINTGQVTTITSTNFQNTGSWDRQIRYSRDGNSILLMDRYCCGSSLPVMVLDTAGTLVDAIDVSEWNYQQVRDFRFVSDNSMIVLAALTNKLSTCP